MQLTELVEKAVNSIDPNSEPLGSGADGIIYPVNEKVVLKLHFQGKIPLFKVTKDSDRRFAEKRIQYWPGSVSARDTSPPIFRII